MCARLLTCPLCSQPGFLTLDALRAGLVSVSTRPLACPVCNEVVLGIDKLTIHLFSHTISNPSATETVTKLIEVRNAQAVQSWNVLNTTGQIDNSSAKLSDDNNPSKTTSGIYIPIDEIETFRNLTAIKDASSVIPVNNPQTIGNDLKAPSQVFFLQNVSSAQPKIFSANVINQIDHPDQLPPGIYQTISTSSATSDKASADENGITILEEDNCNKNDSNGISTDEPMQTNVVITVNNVDETGNKSFTQTTWFENTNTEISTQVSSDYPPSHTDRLADLVKNAQITASPLGTFHEAFDCSKPESSPSSPTAHLSSSQETNKLQALSAEEPEAKTKPRLKSTQILSAAVRTERCNVCGFNFPDRNILILHKQLVHMIQEKDSNVAPEDIMKNYPCHLCTKVFKMRGSLMVHMRVAHPGINTGFSRADYINQNENGNDHESEGPDIEGGYNCPTCGKNFKKEQHVIQHLKIHDGKQYECDVCSKMFTTKYFLKKHKRLHSGEMPYKCNICDKTFTFQQSFHKHRLYHKDDKPHSCTTCGRSFKELSTLHNHERIHTGEKPFACETCGKCFRQRVSYLVHRRIHTGVMPYKCSACGKSFRYKVSQRTHKCTQHPAGVVVQQSGAFLQNLQKNSNKSFHSKAENSTRKEQFLDMPSINEDNDCVLISVSEGKNELKRKADDESSNEGSVNKSSANLDKDNSNDTVDFMQSIWSRDSSNAMDYNDNTSKTDEIVSNLVKEKNIWNDTINSSDNTQILEDSISKHFIMKELKNEFTNNLWNDSSARELNFDKSSSSKDRSSNNTNDLFSMVMFPLQNGIPSPSTEMEHLRLSSPVNNQENTTDVTDSFSTLENNSPSVVQVNCNDVEQHFDDNNSDLSTLQTINEESLKELLYSIVDK